MSKTVWLVTGLIASIQPTLQAQSEIIDRVLAVVTGEVITQSDVDGAIALGLVPAAGRPLGPAQGRKDERSVALDRLIERALMLNEVRRYAPPEPNEAAIDQRLQTIRQRFSSPAALDEALATFGTDEARLREFVRDDLRIQAYLDERFASPEPGRRNAMIADWLTGLRRRTEVTVLYPAR
jgi:parvulin-like peptidyl-prolyl isomerase